MKKNTFCSNLLKTTAIVSVGVAFSLGAPAQAAEISTGTAATEALNAAGTFVGGAAPVSGTDSLKFVGNSTVNANIDFTFASTTGDATGNSIDSGATTSILNVTTLKTITLSGGIASTGGSLTINLGDGIAGTGAIVINGDSVSSQTDIQVNTTTTASRIASITLGDGTGTTTYAGTIDLAATALGAAVLNLNGAVVSGAITDNAASGSIKINATGDSTISGTVDLATSNAANVVTVTDGKTLTLSNTFTVGAAGTIVLGTSTDGGTLALTGAGKTVTGLIDGSATGKGTLALSGTGTTTIASDVGATTALAAITLADGTAAVFSGTVSATKITVSNTNDNTFAEAITGAIDFAADGTVTIAGGKQVATLTTVDNTSGADGVGTLTIGAAGGNVNRVLGAVGATNSLKALNVDVTGDDAGALTLVDTKATTITITGDTDSTDIVALTGNVTGNIAIVGGAGITVTANKSITGAVTVNTTNQGVLTFLTATADTTLASGALGGTGKLLNVVTAGAATGITATLGGDVFATTVSVTNTAADGTVAFSGNVTATNLNITAAGTVTFAANKGVTGNLDNSSTVAGVGTVTFAATTADTTLVSGSTGVSDTLLAVNVAPASGVTATMTGAVAATTLTNTGAGTLKFGSTFAGAARISGGGTIDAVGAITGSVDNTGTAGTGTLTLAATKGVSGAVGATAALATVNADSTGGATAFGAAVTATTVNLAGTGNTTFAGDVTGTVNITAAGTVTFAADQKVVGSVTTSADGQGTLTFGKATTATTMVSGDIGSSSAALLALNIAADAAVIQTFNGNVFARTITITPDAAVDGVNFKGDITAITALNFAADGILNLNGTAAQTISGPITATTTNNGDITVNNTAGVTFTDTIGANGANEIGDITLATGTKATFEDTVDAQTLILTGTANVTVNKAVTLIGTLNTANGNVVTLGSAMISGTTVFNPADSTGDLDQTVGAVTVNADSAFTSGTVTLLANGATLNAADLASFTVVDSALIDYSLALANTNNDIAITATKKSAAATASELNVSTVEATALGNANDALATGDTAAQVAMNSALSSGGAVAKTAAETVGVQPDTLGAGPAASIETGTRVIGVTSDRLGSLRSSLGEQFAATNRQTGFASGDGAMNKAFWARGFGNWTRQDDRGGIAGFDADTLGMTGGIDAEVSDNSRIGVSLSYADTSVDGKGSGSSKVDIASYQATVYGDYSTDKYFVEGSLGYARNSNEASRTIVLPGLTRTANGDYDSNQYMVSAKAGVPMSVGTSSFFTPSIGAAYTRVTSDTYTETGAGNLNLTVNPDDVDAFVLSMGGKLHTRIEQGKGFLVPMLSAGISYDLSGDEAVATGTFTGGGSSFTSTGADVEQLSGNIGFGLAYETDMWSVGANYDLDAKSDYRSHSAKLDMRIKF
jgi:outer membrane autotransporter protein